MKIILPVFPADDVEAALLEHEWAGAPLGLRVLRELRRLPEARVHFFSDQPELVRQARDSAACAHLLDGAGERPDDPLSPRGTAACLAHHALDDCGPSTKIMVLDHRAVLLDADVVKAAWERADLIDPPCLISVVEAKDHPALLYTGHRIVDLDLACLLADRVPAAVLQSPIGTKIATCTRPFRFAWTRADLQRPHPGPYHSFPADGGWRHAPASPEHCTDENAMLLAREGEALARRLYTRNVDPATAGFSVMTGAGSPKVLLTRDAESGDIHVHLSTDLIGPDTSWNIWGVDARGARLAESRRVGASDFDWRTTVRALGRDYTPSAARFADDGERWGFFVAQLERCDAGETDFVEPMLVRQGLWTCSGDSVKRMRASDGRPIHGRQDLMPIHVPDQSITVAVKKAFPRLASLTAERRVLGHPLPEGARLKMRGRFDLLRLEAELTLHRERNGADGSEGGACS